VAERRLRIGIVVTNLPWDVAGGAQLQAVRMAQELGREHDVTIFSRGRPDASDGQALPGIKLVLRNPLPIPWVRLLVDARAAAGQIRAMRDSLDVLVCHQTLGAGLVGAMVRPHGLPFLVYVHGRHEYRMDRLQYRLFVPRVLKAADRVITLDPVLKRELLDAFDHPRFSALRARLEERARVIPNGIDLRPMREGTGRYIIYVGRLIKSKGVDDLLAAMGMLPTVELKIVGAGPDRERLQQLPAPGLGRSNRTWY